MEIDGQYKIYEMALSKFGEDAQIWMAIEEMGELLTALNQFGRGRVTIDELRSEIADVQIMTEQLAVIFGVKEVYKEKERKTFRLLERIKDTSDVFQEKLKKKDVEVTDLK